MVRVIYAHACDFATQGHNGKPVLVGVFTGITLPQIPAGIERFHVFIAVETGPEDADQEQVINVELVDPDGAVTFGEEARQPAEPLQAPKAGYINRVWRNIVFYKHGDHIIRVKVSGADEAYDLPLTIRRGDEAS